MIIAAGLKELASLEYPDLEGIFLTGCIPTGLRDTDNHDLNELSLMDCH